MEIHRSTHNFLGWAGFGTALARRGQAWSGKDYIGAFIFSRFGVAVLGAARHGMARQGKEHSVALIFCGLTGRGNARQGNAGQG